MEEVAMFQELKISIDAMRNDFKISIDAMRNDSKISIDAMRNDSNHHFEALRNDMKTLQGSLTTLQDKVDCVNLVVGSVFK